MSNEIKIIIFWLAITATAIFIHHTGLVWLLSTIAIIMSFSWGKQNRIENENVDDTIRERKEALEYVKNKKNKTHFLAQNESGKIKSKYE